MIKRKVELIYLILFILFITGCSLHGKINTSDLPGVLVWPASSDVHHIHLYGVDLSKDIRTPYIFYKNLVDREITFPSKDGNALICVVDGNKIIKISNEREVDLYQSQDKIFLPASIDDNRIAYLGERNNRSTYFAICNVQSKKNTIVYSNVDLQSKPAISSVGSILYVRTKTNINTSPHSNIVTTTYTIMLMDKTGRVKSLFEGSNPVWLEDGKKLVYFSEGCLKTYDLTTKAKQVIVKDIDACCTPVLSPDKKYLALYVKESSSVFGGKLVDSLQVISLNDGQRMTIPAFKETGEMFGDTGLEWLDDKRTVRDH